MATKQTTLAQYTKPEKEKEASNSHDADCELGFCMNSLHHSDSHVGDGSRHGGGDVDPSGDPVFSSDSITYTWRDINVYTTGTHHRRRKLFFGRNSETADHDSRKHLLKNVSGIALPGELLAILGSSGAGKTTLLNTLMFRSSPNLLVSGHRSLNGSPVSSTGLASLSAYVQQDDLFIGTLTVREHLVFQALVRMDKNIPLKTRMARVEEVITEQGLSKCQNTVIGVTGRIKGISGGEMKRLSFASEVLTNPSLMFCDEPTSGLDSFMAHNVVSVLKNMATKGKTVVATIHQPSSEVFAMFDKVLLMAEGRVAFLGSMDEACKFFRDMGAACPSNYNPADFFIQLLAVVPGREDACRETIDMVYESFQSSEIGQKMLAQVEAQEESSKTMSGAWSSGRGIWGEGRPTDHSKSIDSRRSPYKASWLSQMRAVLWRSWISIIKEPLLIKVRFLQTLMMSILIGVIYFGQELNQDGVMNINGAIFIFLTNMTFQNVFAVVNVFCSEMPVLLREHFNGMYRVDVYFLSKTFAEIPVFTTLPIIFTTITYYMVGLNPAIQRLIAANVTVMLVANVAVSFGYLISCISSSISMALSIGPPIIIPFLLFGGFFLNNSSVPAYFEWLSYLSWFKYGYEALLINQWSDIKHIECTHSNSTCPRNGRVVLEALNFQEDDFTMDIVGLVSLIIAFRLVAFLALLCKTFRKG